MEKVKVIVNYDNIANNYLKMREKTGQEQYCIPVLKADAYGFGCFNVINTLLNLERPQKKYFVFAMPEGISIREFFGDRIDDIYVLCGNLKNEEELFLKYKLTPVINTKEQLINWSNIAKKYDKTLKAVIQFDTGMNRSGNPRDNVDFIKKFVENKDNKIDVEMIMSHFACADDPKHPMVKQQKDNFNRITEIFPNIKRCFCASSAIFEESDCIFEATRPGIFLYGGNNSQSSKKYNLKDVLESIAAKVLKNEDNEYYICMGIDDGLIENFNENACVMVDGEKVFYKKITEDKIILKTDKNIDGKIAIVSGIDEISGEKIFLPDNFDGVIRNEMYCRILPNITFNTEKFELITKNSFDLINNRYKHKKYVNNSSFYKSKTMFKGDKLIYFETVVLEKRVVEEDGWIGYGATREVKKGECFVNVFNGYADAFIRFMSNSNCFLFIENNDGKLIKCEIFGRISMDQFSLKIPAGEGDKISSGNRVIVVDKENNIDCLSDFAKENKVNINEINYMLKFNKRTNLIEI